MGGRLLPHVVKRRDFGKRGGAVLDQREIGGQGDGNSPRREGKEAITVAVSVRKISKK